MPMTDEEVAALKADHQKSSDATKAEIEKLKADLAAATKKPDPTKPDPKDDTALTDKAKLEREAAEKRSKEMKGLEVALKFEMGREQWLKDNASLLPKTIESIFTAADKETYESKIQKDADIKAGIIQEFFKVQSNVDLLTPSQKTALDDYLKLTKNGKQEQSQQVYDMIFEPTFETLRKVKKAEQLNRTDGKTDSEKAYAERLMKGSRTHYLGEKQ